MKKKIPYIGIILIIVIAGAGIVLFPLRNFLSSNLFGGTVSYTSLLFNDTLEDRDSLGGIHGWDLTSCPDYLPIPNSTGSTGNGLLLDVPVCLMQFQNISLEKGLTVKASARISNPTQTTQKIFLAILHNKGSHTQEAPEEYSISGMDITPGTFALVTASLSLKQNSTSDGQNIGFVLINPSNSDLIAEETHMEVNKALTFTPLASSSAAPEWSNSTVNTSGELLKNISFEETDPATAKAKFWHAKECPSYTETEKSPYISTKTCIGQYLNIPASLSFNQLRGEVAVRTSQNTTGTLLMGYGDFYDMENISWTRAKSSGNFVKDIPQKLSATIEAIPRYNSSKRTFLLFQIPRESTFSLESAHLTGNTILSQTEQTVLNQFKATGTAQYGNIELKVMKQNIGLIQDPLKFLKAIDNLYLTYKDMIGGVPYNGAPISVVEKCSYNASVSNPDTPTADCPNGYMAWGIAGGAFPGQPLVILDTEYAKQGFQVFNTTGALSLLFMHEFGHNFDNVAKRPQYLLNSAVIEAMANLKMVLAIDRGHQPMEFQGKVYGTTAGALTGDSFYAPFYQTYKSQNYTFDSLRDGVKIPNQSDLYMSILFHISSSLEDNHQSLINTLQLYTAGGDSIRSIPNFMPEEKLNQLVYFWSAIAKKDLSTNFISENFPITNVTRNKITTYLSSPASQQTVQNIIAIDIQGNTQSIPANISQKFSNKRNSMSTNAFYYTSDILLKDGYYIQDIKQSSDASPELLMYNTSMDTVFLVPWWNYDFMKKDPIFTKYGAPKENFHYDSANGRGWTQDFEKGRFIYPSGGTLTFISQ